LSTTRSAVLKVKKDEKEVIIIGSVMLLDFTLFPVKPTTKTVIDLGGRLSTALISNLS